MPGPWGSRAVESWREGAMEAAEGGVKSSLEIVREFLEALQGRDPRPDEVRRIRPALDDLVAKVARLQRLSPAFARVAMSDEVVRLIRIARDQDNGWLRSAAVF